MNENKTSRFFLPALFVYHMLFSFFSYHYIAKKGGDSLLYWFQTDSTQNKAWFDFLSYGTEVLLFINYPLVKWFSIPFFWGFVLYGLIGFIGFIQIYRLALLMIKKSEFLLVTRYLLYAFLFLPNAHFWTSMIGKESIIFAALTTLLLKAYQQKFTSILSILSFLIIVFIRPHVTFILLLTLGVIILFSTKIKVKNKIIAFGTITISLWVSFYMFLQLSQIKRFDWSRIQRFNLASLRSFDDSNSFVPMENYSYPMKLFTFYLRPFFEKTNSLYYWVLSIENLFMLVFTLIGFVLLFKYRKIWWNDDFIKFILLFCLLFGLLFIQRYSGLGIFVRTKIMFMPFLGLVLLTLINQFWNEKSKVKSENVKT